MTSEQYIPSLKMRDCPYCRRSVPTQGQVCEHCGGNMAPGEMQGLDWRNKPALPTQMRFLRLLKVKVPGEIGRGLAADMIGEIKAEDPELFKSAAERDRKGGSRNLPINIVKIVILLAAIVYALMHFGVVKI